MEKKFIVIIIIILLVFFGRIFGKKVFEPTTKVSVDDKNKAVNNTDVMSDGISNDEKNNVKYDYMDLYPDLYVEDKEECPLTETDQTILDVGKDSIEYAKSKVCDKQEEEGEEKKVAFLTFDDGPSNNTEKVLDILKEHDIKATFFVIADMITPDRYELIKQMVDEGHVIGIHTYSHNYRKIYSSVKAYLDDFYLAYTRIKEVTGVAPTVYRFPGGSHNCFMKPIRKRIITEMQRRGFTFYDWHVSAEDSVENPSKSSIMHNIRKDYKKYNTPIILLHDSSINELTTNTLEDIISLYENAGYSFDTVNHRVSRKIK